MSGLYLWVSIFAVMVLLLSLGAFDERRRLGRAIDDRRRLERAESERRLDAYAYDEAADVFATYESIGVEGLSIVWVEEIGGWRALHADVPLAKGEGCNPRSAVWGLLRDIKLKSEGAR